MAETKPHLGRMGTTGALRVAQLALSTPLPSADGQNGLQPGPSCHSRGW